MLKTVYIDLWRIYIICLTADQLAKLLYSWAVLTGMSLG